MKFNEKVKYYIEHKGIIKHRVAEVAGITPSAFFRFLNGTSTMKSSGIEKINEVWPEIWLRLRFLSNQQRLKQLKKSQTASHNRG